jgi:hypothetical protein
VVSAVTIAAEVYDAIVLLGGQGCSLHDICVEVSDHDRPMVVSAIHRLREMGVLKIRHDFRIGSVYTITPGAQRPIDGRGRPRKPRGEPEVA